MGEIADDIVEGLICAECGDALSHCHGYPVLCHECFESARRSGIQPAYQEEVDP